MWFNLMKINIILHINRFQGRKQLLNITTKWILKKKFFRFYVKVRKTFLELYFKFRNYFFNIVNWKLCFRFFIIHITSKKNESNKFFLNLFTKV